MSSSSGKPPRDPQDLHEPLDPSAASWPGAAARSFGWFDNRKKRRRQEAAHERQLDERARMIREKSIQMEADLARLRPAPPAAPAQPE